jgi:hypothetical protein
MADHPNVEQIRRLYEAFAAIDLDAIGVNDLTPATASPAVGTTCRALRTRGR